MLKHWFMKQIIYAVSCATLLSVSIYSYADVSPPANLLQQCQTYIQPDSQFFPMIENLSQSNLPMAQNIADLLNQCDYYNICNQITNIQNCSGLLATNAHYADYITQYVELNANNSMGSIAPQPVAPTTSTSIENTQQSVPQNTAPAPTVTPAPTTTTPAAGKTNSDVRWF